MLPVCMHPWMLTKTTGLALPRFVHAARDGGQSGRGRNSVLDMMAGRQKHGTTASKCKFHANMVALVIDDIF
jgi:hypothetical protein